MLCACARALDAAKHSRRMCLAWPSQRSDDPTPLQLRSATLKLPYILPSNPLAAHKVHKCSDCASQAPPLQLHLLESKPPVTSRLCSRAPPSQLTDEAHGDNPKESTSRDDKQVRCGLTWLACLAAAPRLPALPSDQAGCQTLNPLKKGRGSGHGCCPARDGPCAWQGGVRG
jgi:hypothetical protein